MRKPLLVARIAATALVPVAATAQEWQGRRGGNRGEAQSGAPRERMARPDTAGGFKREQFRAERQAQRVEQPQAAAPARAPRDFPRR